MLKLVRDRGFASRFVAGKNDPTLKFVPGGARGVRRSLPKWCGVGAPSITILGEGKETPKYEYGHWIQQEKPDEVNAALLAFLKEHAGDSDAVARV